MAEKYAEYGPKNQKRILDLLGQYNSGKILVGVYTIYRETQP